MEWLREGGTGAGGELRAVGTGSVPAVRFGAASFLASLPGPASGFRLTSTLPCVGGP